MSELDKQLQRIEKVREFRRNKFYLRDEQITLSHGSGGKATHNLIEGIFAQAFSNPLLDKLDDSALIPLEGTATQLAFTTDSYVVNPIFFPGSDIGELAVNGTVNDLAMAGAKPIALSVGMILEEGFAISDLRRVVASMQSAAESAGVPIVTGDTKVVNRGSADKIFINTAGIGLVDSSLNLSSFNAKPSDKILLSGTLGEHGIAVMMAREAMDLEQEIESDSAALHSLVAELLEAVPNVRCLKDPTRGGLATSLNEIAINSNVGIAVEETAIPVMPQVRSVCEILGLDPLTIANEGKLIAIVPAESAQLALETLQKHPLGRDACIIGDIHTEPPGMVFMRTEIGGSRVLDMLVGDPLPRIC